MLMTDIDNAIEKCIQKFRDAKTGTQVKTFIAEYEELMFLKTKLLTRQIMEEPKNNISEPTEIDGQGITAVFVKNGHAQNPDVCERLQNCLADFVEHTIENARDCCALPESIKILPDIARLLFEVSGKLY